MIKRKITIKAMYTGVNKRGLLVGGIPCLPGRECVTRVDEQTFAFLKKGQESGWFKIIEDNYNEYLASKNRFDEIIEEKEDEPTAIPEVEDVTKEEVAEEKKEEEVVEEKEEATEEKEEATEEKKEEEVAEAPKKTTRKRTTTKTKAAKAEETEKTEEVEK